MLHFQKYLLEFNGDLVGYYYVLTTVGHILRMLWARREGKQLSLKRDQFEVDSTLFCVSSLMPIISDVIVPNASTASRGRIAAVGLIVPTILAGALWIMKTTIIHLNSVLADAFLIYPMVQCFPLAPLEGIYIWRWDKSLWLFFFIVIMSMFMLMASEALRGII